MRLNIKNALLAFFIVLTVIFASVALDESITRTRTVTVTAATSALPNLNSSTSSTCALPGPLPPNPLGGGGYVGSGAFAFVGGNSTCIEVAPSAPGSNFSTTEFAFALNATRQLFLTMDIDTNGNGILTVPDGTSFTAAVVSQTFPVYQTLRISPVLFIIPAGTTTFDFQVSVHNPYQPGVYHFVVLINAWSDSAKTQGIWGDDFRANLVAR